MTTKVLEAGVRQERDALAGVVAHNGLTPLLAEITPEHFDVELHRRVREHLLAPAQTADRDLVGMLAELDARAVDEEIDEDTAKELLLRLRERGIRRSCTLRTTWNGPRSSRPHWRGFTRPSAALT